MNFSQLKRMSVDGLIEKEKTDEEKVAQNLAFAELKARALNNEVDSYPAGREQFFRSIPTNETLTDPVLSLLKSLTPIPKSLRSHNCIHANTSPEKAITQINTPTNK